MRRGLGLAATWLAAALFVRLVDRHPKWLIVVAEVLLGVLFASTLAWLLKGTPLP